MKPKIVLSLEQALSLPSATLRFAQLGWRVIRIEATPTGRGLPGDPIRYIAERPVNNARADIAVGIAGQAAAGGRRLEADHPPAQLGETQGR